MLQPGDAAGKGTLLPLTEALDPRDGDGCGGCDALIEQIIFAAPGAGIAIDLRRKQAHDGAYAIAAAEGLRVRLALRSAHGEPHATLGPGLLIDSIVDDFNA